MFKLKKNVIYFVILLVALTIYIVQKSGIVLPYFIQNYTNDILIMPLMLRVMLLVLRRIYGESFWFSNFHLFVVWVYFSLLFELVFPLFLTRYTADFFDIIAYLVGILIFKMIER